MKKFVLFIIFTFAMIFTAGCETSEGVGKDLENAGQAIQEAAQEVKQEMDQNL